MNTAQDFISPELTPVNYILLQGQQSAGYAEILDLGAPRRLRIMAGMGFDGAAVAFGGFTEQHFSIKFYLRNDQDWRDWHVFKQLLTKAASLTQTVGGTPVKRTLDIYHPFLADPLYNITAVTIEDVGGYAREGDKGEWSVTVKFVSALKPKPSFAVEEQSKDQPMDALDRQIADNATKIGQRQSTLDALAGQKASPP